MELELLGRVLAQVEQARAHVPPAARLRVDDLQLQDLAQVRYVPDVLPVRGDARARDGDRDEENQVVFVHNAGLWNA